MPLNWIPVVSLADSITRACLMEATARKPGNVHPQAAFVDLCYEDFVLAAHAIAEPLSQTRRIGLGQAILNSVRATRDKTGTNVNLGIILLIAPLAAVPERTPLELGLTQVLRQTTIADAEAVYEAIRLAMPGGLGHAAKQDVSQRPTVNLRDAMSLAASRDRIAEQYDTDYSLVFAARNRLVELIRSQDWETATILLQLWIMSNWPDTLIVRKCGPKLAEEAALQAARVLNSYDEEPSLFPQHLDHFDAWLRADGHRRNPGTTADLVAATLFAALRDDLIEAPSLEEIRRMAAAGVNE